MPDLCDCNKLNSKDLFILSCVKDNECCIGEIAKQHDTYITENLFRSINKLGKLKFITTEKIKAKRFITITKRGKENLEFKLFTNELCGVTP